MGEKIVIIGSGPGGSAAGALLAAKGHAVTILEAKPFAGGRCGSMHKDGFCYDFGVHMFSRGDAGPHGEVNRLVKGGLKWVQKNPAARVMGTTTFDFPLDINRVFTKIGLAWKLGVEKKNYPGAYRLIKALMHGGNLKADDGITVQEFADRYTQDARLHLFLTCLSQLYFALSYKEASAGEFIWCFRRMFRDASFGYPVGGAGAIPASFLDRFQKNTGTLVLDAPVKAIDISDGKVKGVKTEHHYYPADTVISNAGVHQTIELSGRGHFPKDYLNRVEKLRLSNSYITIKYALAHPIIPYPVVFHMPDLPPDKVFQYIDEKKVPEDLFLFMPVPSNLDPGLAPKGKQLVIAGTVAPPYASEALCQDILDQVHAKVCGLFPNLEKAIQWQIRSSRADTSCLVGHPAGECVGVAQTPAQVGIHRLDIKTPVEGLLLVGADAGARGIGTELAVGSALNLAEKFGSIS